MGRLVARYPSSVSEEQSANLTFRVMHHMKTKQTCPSPNPLVLLLPASHARGDAPAGSSQCLSHDSHVVGLYVCRLRFEQNRHTHARPFHITYDVLPVPGDSLSPLASHPASLHTHLGHTNAPLPAHGRVSDDIIHPWLHARQASQRRNNTTAPGTWTRPLLPSRSSTRSHDGPTPPVTLLRPHHTLL